MPVTDDRFYAAAIDDALSDEGMREAMAAAGDPDELRPELVAHAMAHRNDVEQAAADELEALAAARAAFPDAEDVDAEESPARADLERLRVERDALQRQQDAMMREDQRRREQIESFRTETELLRTRSSTGTLRAEDLEAAEVARRKRAGRLGRWRRAGQTSIDFLFQERSHQLEQRLQENQAHRKKIADVVTAKKRLEMSILRLESRIAAADARTPVMVRTARSQLEATRARARRALVERGLRPLFRRWLNQRQLSPVEARYGTDLSAATASGLGELPDPEHTIDTRAEHRLRRTLENLPGGSIGISGPRGAGKTTLLRAFCGDRRGDETAEPPSFNVLVSAPVRFAPLEFVLHLFEQVCLAVLPSDTTVEPLDEQVQRSRHQTTVWVAAGGAAIAGIATLILGLDAAESSTTTNLWLLATALATVILGAVAWRLVELGPLRLAITLSTVLAFGTVALLLTDDADQWRVVDGVVIGLAILPGTFVLAQSPPAGSRWGTSIARLLDKLPWALLLAPTAFVAVAIVTDRSVGTPFFVGSLILVAATLGRKGAQTRMRAETLEPVGWTVTAVGLQVMLLAWDHRTLTVGVALGTVLLATATVASQTQTAGPQRRRPLVLGTDIADTTQRIADFQRITQDRLRQIRYIQNYKSDWTTKAGMLKPLGLPISAEASRAIGLSATEQPLTLPAAIGALRKYLADAAELAGRFVIGIDELDKIGSPAEAEAFLNEIKAIFGIRGCYFIISVSEDAVAGFERRGMPFRDVLDSAFDDVIRVEHFSLDTTESMLAGRTVGVPLPFIALCHALGGGLPRDVIRLARRMFELRDDLGDGTLPVLCRALLAVELDARRAGTTTEIGRLRDEADTAEVLRWLDQADGSGMAQLATCPATVGNDDEAGRRLRRLARELAAYWYLTDTLGELFSSTRSEGDFQRLESLGDPRSIETLAAARRAFSVDPQIAWGRVSAFRAAWGMTVMEPPSSGPVAETPVPTTLV